MNKALQKRFKQKLRVLKWKRDMEKARRWRNKCLHDYDVWLYNRGHLEPTTRQLHQWLGRLAGLNPDSLPGAIPIAEHGRPWGGPPGYRTCPPALWDNSVRAWEEDR